MPRFTSETARQAGQRRAAQFTSGYQRAAGQARAARMTPDELRTWGARGYAATAARYGEEVAQAKVELARTTQARLAAWRAAHPTCWEVAVTATLDSLHLGRDVDYRREVVVEYQDATGAARWFRLDFVFAGQRVIEPGDSRWHDPDQDAARDAVLAQLGWRVLHLDEHTLADPARTRAAIYRWLVATGGIPGDAATAATASAA